MGNVHSIDVEEDQFAYRYDTQLLIEGEGLDEDVMKIWMKLRLQNIYPNILKETV